MMFILKYYSLDYSCVIDLCQIYISYYYWNCILILKCEDRICDNFYYVYGVYDGYVSVNK